MAGIDKRDTKLLQILIDGQQALREDINRNEQSRVKDNAALVNRVDKIGYHLAELDDDSPSREEFEELEK